MGINIIKNGIYNIKNEAFVHAVSGKKIKERTKVSMRATNSRLIVSFDCLDNPYVDENTYYIDNSDLFKQEVFEIFISQGSEDPTEYLEIEINPLGALFCSFITNEDKLGSKLISNKIEKASSGIIAKVKKDIDNWSGEISIPLKLINRYSTIKEKNYRINFYRIISQKSHKNPDWEGSMEDCIYACWKSTNSPQKPRFHRSQYFGRLFLDI